MNIKLELPQLTDLKPRLTVIGVGGAGCNAINNMIAAGLTGVEFVAANTDAQTLEASSAEHRIQLGMNLTEGLGAGANPEIGAAAAEEAIDEIKSQISGSHMCFLAAGMGGGTGTGAISVIARASRELGILTVGVVTKPFQFEGSRRMRMAEAGITDLRQNVDTLIVIPNQNLFRVANEKTTFAEAFLLADQVLYSGVACIVDLIVKEGLINLDFADVKAVMSNMGTAMMGTGEGSGERRAIMAAEEAIANPLLDDVTLSGAKGLLLSITGGPNLTLYEVDEAASRVRKEVDSEANIIVGATFDDTMQDRVRVSIVASGMASASAQTSGSAGAGTGGLPLPAAFGRPAASSSTPPPPPPPPISGRVERREPSPAPPPMPERGPLADPVTDRARPDPDGMAGRAGEAGDRSGKPKSAGDGAGAEAKSASTQSPFPPERTAAVRGSAPAQQKPPPPPPVPQGQPPSGVVWTAPDGVTIEAGGDPLRSRQRATPPPQQQQPVPPRVPPGQPFEPRQTQEIHRRSQMPRIEDFPEPGQRDYYEKRSRDSGGERPAASRPAVADAGRKPGLFSMLTGLGRRQDDSPAAGDTGKPGSVTERDMYREDTARGARSDAVRDTRGASTKGEEDVELPEFFSRDQGRG